MTVATWHLQRLGLEHNPFPPAPDAEHYFHTVQLERDFAEALHCLLAGKGFVLLDGEVGMGKSTFLRRLIDALLKQDARVALMFNTFLQGAELLRAILSDFGLQPTRDIAGCIGRLNAFLIEQHMAGFTCVLVIDDAQNLDIESLELVRLLSNLESGQQKLLQIVLAGQPELQARLAQPQIRQLASRIVKHLHLAPLSRVEIGRYVAFRLAQAGSAGKIQLSNCGLRRLAMHSRGNPRRIHLIMDHCLYGVLQRQNGLIDGQLVDQAAAQAGFRAVPKRAARRSRGMWFGVPALLASGLILGATLWPSPVATPGLPVPANALAPASQAVVQQATAAQPAAAPGVTALGEAWLRCVRRLGGQSDTLCSGSVPRVHLPRALQAGGCLLRDGEPALVLWQGAAPATLDIQALQTRLAELGLYTGNLDGRWGALSRSALTQFQHRQGLPANGEPDELTLALLTASAAPRHDSPEDHQYVEQ